VTAADVQFSREEHVLLAVNGGLMRGLYANDRMRSAGGRFVREARTSPKYRLWSVDDRFPAMLRANDGVGAEIAVEIWEITPGALLRLYMGEPTELTLGKVVLEDGTHVIGVLGESAIVAGQREITAFGGWRAYIRAEGIDG
jgi:hypothetical protein